MQRLPTAAFKPPVRLARGTCRARNAFQEPGSPASGTHQCSLEPSRSSHSGKGCHLSPGPPAPWPRSCSVAEDWLAMWSKNELPASPFDGLGNQPERLGASQYSVASAHTDAGGCTRSARAGESAPWPCSLVARWKSGGASSPTGTDAEGAPPCCSGCSGGPGTTSAASIKSLHADEEAHPPSRQALGHYSAVQEFLSRAASSATSRY